MAKKFFYFLFAVFLLTASVLSVTPAIAQSLTATPTRTPYPTFYPTSTQPVYSFPTDFVCPLGTPYGYGTVTPSSFWDLSCNKCLITPIATSSPFPSPTVTGTPPTAMPTVTVAPSGCGDFSSVVYDEYEGNINAVHSQSVVCVDVSSSTVSCEGTLDSTWVGAPYDGAVVCIPFKVYVPADFDMWLRTTIYDDSTNVYYPAHNKVSNGCVTDGSGDTPWYHLYGATTETDHHGTGSSYFSSYYSGYRTVWLNTANGGTSAGFPGTTLHLHFKMVFSMGEACLDDTVSPTPQPGYCSIVEDGGNPTGDSSISWEGVRYGYNACVQIGGWSFSVVGVDVDIPLIEICLQDVSFANAVVFGMSISLDSILYVLVGAWALKRMFTS